MHMAQLIVYGAGLALEKVYVFQQKRNLLK